MKIQDIKSIAKKKSVTAGKMNQTDLIRAIQKAEGNNACFATSSVQTCGQMNCMWRTDCKQDFTFRFETPPALAGGVSFPL